MSIQGNGPQLAQAPIPTARNGVFQQQPLGSDTAFKFTENVFNDLQGQSGEISEGINASSSYFNQDEARWEQTLSVDSDPDTPGAETYVTYSPVDGSIFSAEQRTTSISTEFVSVPEALGGNEMGAIFAPLRED